MFARRRGCVDLLAAAHCIALAATLLGLRRIQQLGPYSLLYRMASGGMAEIYLARTRTAYGTEKFVALKMIHPRYMEQSSFQEMIVETYVPVRYQVDRQNTL